MGLRKSHPKPAELRLLICEGKKIGIGRRTWRSQKSKAPRTRLDSKKSAKSYETDCISPNLKSTCNTTPSYSVPLVELHTKKKSGRKLKIESDVGFDLEKSIMATNSLASGDLQSSNPAKERSVQYFIAPS